MIKMPPRLLTFQHPFSMMVTGRWDSSYKFYTRNSLLKVASRPRAGCHSSLGRGRRRRRKRRERGGGRREKEEEKYVRMPRATVSLVFKMIFMHPMWN